MTKGNLAEFKALFEVQKRELRKILSENLTVEQKEVVELVFESSRKIDELLFGKNLEFCENLADFKKIFLKNLNEVKFIFEQNAMCANLVETNSINPPLNFEKTKLESVFSNILNNCAAHGKKNSTVQFFIEANKGEIYFSAENEIEKLYSKQFSKKDNFNLGLKIIESSICALGGHFWVVQGENKFKINFTLPC